MTLIPLFDSLPPETLADVTDAIRMRGDEPPDLFSWFAIPCDETIVDTILPLVEALPFVLFAERRSETHPAGVVSWGTNPQARPESHLSPAPLGVDAIHAWQVAGAVSDGAEVADIEHGWDLSHEDLLRARIRRHTFAQQSAIEHGTSVLSIIAGGDNGVGTVGIVPHARVHLFSDENLAAAIAAAAFTVRPAGVVLLEVALAFTPDPSPDIPVEFERATQEAIRWATFFGITVVEPAGNRGVDLDAFPFFAHLQPTSPTFVDSRAIVVGGATLHPTKQWDRLSTHGARVDCFAAFDGITAAGKAPSTYREFGGTSGASAIVAGVVATIQGMAVAATTQPLLPTDIRRLLRNPDLGTRIVPPFDGGIGAMPDLRKIARSQGWARVLPVAAVATADNAMAMATLDDDDHLVIRHWAFGSWGNPIALEPPDDQISLLPVRPAMLSVTGFAPAPAVHVDVLVHASDGVHHYWRDSDNAHGSLATLRASNGSLAPGADVAAVRVRPDTLLVCGISLSGHLVALGGPDVTHAEPLNAVLLDAVARFRRMGGPEILSRSAGSVDLVAIEDGGSLRWYAGSVPIGGATSTWSAGVSDVSGTVLDAGARPGLAVSGSTLFVAAVGNEGWLYATTIDPVAQTIEAPAVVDPQVTIATQGPLALAVVDDRLVALAVDSDLVLRVASRPVAANGAWTELTPVDEDVRLSALGGVTAVVMPDIGVAAIAVSRNGSVCWSSSADGSVWDPLAVA